MNNDLISRKETERLLRAYADEVCMRSNENDLANGICKAACFIRDVKAVPAVHDMEKAIEEIEKEILRRKDRLLNSTFSFSNIGMGAVVCRSELRGLEKALEIIKIIQKSE